MVMAFTLCAALCSGCLLWHLASSPPEEDLPKVSLLSGKK